MSRSIARLAIVAILAMLCGRSLGEHVRSPLEPADSLAHLQLDPGLEISLVACEPEVIDPIAIRFDEDGRLWVVEMRDYPHGPPEGQPPLSKIRLLTDENGDGRYETAHTFAEDLLFPTGLQPWRGGLIVTLAGEVIYLKDTDGDSRADLRETWFTGFTAENPQLRANHPRFGLDNRVYIANGLRGGTVVDPRRPDSPPVQISGRDFRFDPRDGTCQAISGNGQFGLSFDAFGNRFVCSNRNPLDHVVLEGRYLARNPLLAVPAIQTPAAAAGEASRVYPRTSAWTTSNLHAGQFTAACGIELDRGSALGDSYRGNSFTCEPTGSLVHRETITPLGATFRGQPATPGKEFLSSDDSWFRPVNLEWGPDGALYVVDMYRAVIEHPQFMPSELQHRPDMRLGDDRGRIYRIVRKDFQSAGRPQLSSTSTVQLVELLAHEHSWYRETAARLLFERQDASAVEPLEHLVRQHENPVARAGALGALDGLQRLSAPLLETALTDKSPRVREQAVVLSENLLREDAALRKQVIALAGDADPRLRFQVALSLGGVRAAEVIPPLAQIALDQADDVWTRNAVATARPESIAAILTAMLESDRLADAPLEAPSARAIAELAEIVGARREPAEVTALVKLTCDNEAANPAIRATALLGLAEGFARRGGALLTFVADLPDTDALASSLTQSFDRATAAALDESLPEATRVHALQLLAHARHEAVTHACLRIATQNPSQQLRIQAAAALAKHPDESVAPALLRSYADQTPAVRSALRDALAVQPAAAQQLLEAVKSGQIARAELGATLETRLKQHRDESVRTLAAKVLTSEIPAERRAVLADYQNVIKQTADPIAGKSLFRQHCATCHHIGDVGVDVAPDISDSRVKTPEQLLTDILNPNQAIDNNYVSYTVVTADGNVHTGLIAAETASSVTLRQPENKTQTLLRADIESIKSSGVSLMPEGFEKHLTHQQMADLIAFVKNWRYLEQAIPGTIGAAGGK